MNKLKALNTVLNGLRGVLQEDIGPKVSSADWTDVNAPVLEAIRQTEKSIKTLECELKKTARKRLINAVVKHFKDVGVYSPTNEQISNCIDIKWNGYTTADDIAEGQEFFLWYWSRLDQLGAWSYAQNKRINHKETRFFNDIRKGLSR